MWRWKGTVSIEHDFCLSALKLMKKWEIQLSLSVNEASDSEWAFIMWIIVVCFGIEQIRKATTWTVTSLTTSSRTPNERNQKLKLWKIGFQKYNFYWVDRYTVEPWLDEIICYICDSFCCVKYFIGNDHRFRLYCRSLILIFIFLLL